MLLFTGNYAQRYDSDFQWNVDYPNLILSNPSSPVYNVAVSGAGDVVVDAAKLVRHPIVLLLFQYHTSTTTQHCVV